MLHPRSWLALAAGLLPAIVLVFLPGPTASDPVRLGPAASLGLSAEEARLWVEQGVHTPAPHLRSQSEIRRAGGVTRLRVAVILVEFPDAPADHTLHPASHYERLLFSRGELPTRSAADFLYESSGGRVILEGAVRGWYTAALPKREYTKNQGGLGAYPLNSQRLGEEAFLLGDPHINYGAFDSDGPDGVADSGDDDELVDGFFIVHQGAGREGGLTSPNDFVSVHWWTPTPVHADGVFGRFFTLNPEDGNIGVFLHELGHLMGLPDLYDIDGGSFGLGAWSIMAGGAILGGGETPADFDAWSKAELGFVDVVQVLANERGLVIPPTVDTQRVYRLWPSGGSTEYFLLENRHQSRLDAALPGSGILVYHVDERVPSNSDPSHYRVALEQADGFYQLENRYGTPSVGDAGDPFGPGDEFSHYTDPSNEGYDGRDTHVTLFDIGAPASDGTMTANLFVEPGPLVDLADVRIEELEGNGDGLLSAGEIAGVTPRIAVSRFPAEHVRIGIRSLDPLGSMEPLEVELGTVAPGDPVPVPETASLRIAEGLPSDPYGLRLEITLAWDDAPERVVGAEIGIGTQVGRHDDFENPQHDWTVGAVRPSSFNQWTYGPHFGTQESAGFHHGYARGYRRGCDAVLVSPPILTPLDAVLVYDQRVEIFAPDLRAVEAGGVVEVSINGGAWQSVTPSRGYNAVFSGQNPDWEGRPVYAGTLDAGAFHENRIDLSGIRGSIRVRFRFYSEVEATVGRGWSIDNVRLVSASTPVRVLSVRSRVEGDDVVLSWELADPLPAAVRWLRNGSDVVGAGWLPAAASGDIRDAGGRVRLPSAYWLEGRERDGSVARFGPWDVVGAGVLQAWRVLANPSVGAVGFAWTSPLSENSVLEVFDVRGARVRGLPIPAGTAQTLWDGRDDGGRPARPGIYFARVRGSVLPPLRLVRLP